MMEISGSTKRMREEFHRKNLKKVGHLRKKNKGPYLSNLPAKMRRAKKTEENWASQEKKIWGFISAIV